MHIIQNMFLFLLFTIYYVPNLQDAQMSPLRYCSFVYKHIYGILDIRNVCITLHVRMYTIALCCA